MKFLLFAFSSFLISTVSFAQDDFWSNSAPVTSTTTASSGFSASEAVGLYGMRDPASLSPDGANGSINDQMTNWEILWQQGEAELRKYVENQVKNLVRNEIRKAVGREAGKALGNQLGGTAGNLAGDILFGNPEKQAAEAERQAQLEAERVARRQQEIMHEYQAEFRSLLVDNNLSVVPLVPQTLVFMVNLEEGNAISFSLFNLQPNSYGELPYKIDLVKDYQKKTGKTQNYLYGPYKTVEHAREEIKKIAFMAFLGFYEVKEDVVYTFGKSQSAQPTSTPSASDDSFWGTTKKSGN